MVLRWSSSYATEDFPRSETKRLQTVSCNQHIRFCLLRCNQLFTAFSLTRCWAMFNSRYSFNSLNPILTQNEGRSTNHEGLSHWIQAPKWFSSTSLAPHCLVLIHKAGVAFSSESLRDQLMNSHHQHALRVLHGFLNGWKLLTLTGDINVDRTCWFSYYDVWWPVSNQAPFSAPVG